ncbi:MAG: GNAT family protein [Ignavibacteriaceae bacterium]|nr:GNAT family protein [Ignavibacteriaceae bacterium]
MEFSIFFRALKLEDAEFINSLRRIEEMENKIGGNKRFVALERETKWVNDLIMNDNPGFIYVAVCEKGSDAIIGYASITEIDYRNGRCYWGGIKLLPEKAGKGYGFQAALLLLKYVFEELRMERCAAEGLEEHTVGLKLMEKAGFKKEGLMRKHIYKNGEYKNNWLLSILKEEYEVLKKKYEI